MFKWLQGLIFLALAGGMLLATGKLQAYDRVQVFLPKGVYLTQSVEYAIDPDSVLTAAELYHGQASLTFAPIEQLQSFKTTHSTFWLRFTVTNPRPEARRLILVPQGLKRHYPNLVSFTHQIKPSNKEKKVHTKRVSTDRKLFTPVYDLVFPEKSITSVYMELDAETVPPFFKVDGRDPESYYRHETNTLFIGFAFFCLLGVLVWSSIQRWGGWRHAYWSQLLALALGLILIHSALDGAMLRWLLPDWQQLQALALPLGVGLFLLGWLRIVYIKHQRNHEILWINRNANKWMCGIVLMMGASLLLPTEWDLVLMLSALILQTIAISTGWSKLYQKPLRTIFKRHKPLLVLLLGVGVWILGNTTLNLPLFSTLVLAFSGLSSFHYFQRIYLLKPASAPIPSVPPLPAKEKKSVLQFPGGFTPLPEWQVKVTEFAFQCLDMGCLVWHSESLQVAFRSFPTSIKPMISGLMMEELNDFYDTIHAGDRKEMQQEISRASRNQLPLNWEARFHAENEEPKWFKFHFVPVLQLNAQFPFEMLLFHNIEGEKISALQLASYQDLIENAQEGVLLCDPGWKIQFMNAKALQFLNNGIKAREGMQFSSFFTQECRDTFKMTIDLQLKKEKIWEGELELLHEQSSKPHLWLVMVPHLNAQGQLQQIMVYMRNISDHLAQLSYLKHIIKEQKYKNLQLTRNNDSLRSLLSQQQITTFGVDAYLPLLSRLFEHSELVVCIATTSGQIPLLQGAALQHFGVSEADNNIVTLEQLCDLVPELGNCLKDSLSGETCRKTITVRDNALVVWSMPLISLSNKVEGAVCLAQEFGETHLYTDSEEGPHADQLLDSLPALIGYLDQDYHFRYVNHHCQTWYHLKPFQVIGKSFAELEGKAAYSVLVNHLQRASDGSVANFELQLEYENRPERHIRGAFIPYLRHEVVQGLILIMIDVTESQKQMEINKQINDHVRQAQKIEALGTLASGIAHDFNNILHGIQTATHKASMTLKESDPTLSVVEQIQGYCDRGRDLVKQILTFGRKDEARHEIFNLAPLISDTSQFMRSAFPTLKIKQSVKTEMTSIYGNRTQFQQVLVNLCTNAAHAMKNTGGILTIALDYPYVYGSEARVLALEAGNYIRLRVSDTGEGIPEEVKERIFEPFYTTKPPGEGTGMGLAVVHGIVRNHGGAIRVYSKHKHGSTFEVYFPSSRQKEAIAAPVKKEPVIKGKERILLVEDEVLIAEDQRLLLQSLGYKVTVISKALDALRRVRQSPEDFDLIISDQNMPHMTGIELSKEVQKLNANLPVILITGYAGDFSLEELRQHGIQDRLIKPFDLETLSRSIREVLNHTAEDGHDLPVEKPESKD